MMHRHIAKEPKLGSLGVLKQDQAFVDAFSKNLAVPRKYRWPVL